MHDLRIPARRAHPALLALLCALLPGCSSNGPGRVPLDHFDYNTAIARSSNEQMLLNLVRLRYSEVPTFLAVSSVLTQYIWSGVVGVEGAYGASLGDPLYSAGGTATFRFVERPTITYSPLAGQEFAAQLITPVPTDLVFSLVQSGWPPDQLMMMAIQRVNVYRSLAFVPGIPQDRREHLEKFARTMDLFVALSKNEAIEMQRDEAEVTQRYLTIQSNLDADRQQMVDELRSILELSAEHSRFRVTTRIVGIKPDEVTVRVRSLLEMMGFLARGVEVPPQHRDEQRVALDTVIGADLRRFVPIRILSQDEPPTDAFVSVLYADHWFYIPHADHDSKQAFGLLTYLFQMQAPQRQGAGPLLTVPTG